MSVQRDLTIVTQKQTAATLMAPSTVNVTADFLEMEDNVQASYVWMGVLFLSSVMRHAWFVLTGIPSMLFRYS